MAKVLTALFLLILAALVVARIFFIDMLVVPQNGMYPTIPQRSLVLARKRPYGRIAEVTRGDIVVFKRVENGATYLYVWRVVGLPGDRVVASRDSLSVNGTPVQRVPVRDEDGLAILKEAMGGASYEVAIAKAPQEVPPNVDALVGADELFVMGDNRYNARDSRYFGAIKFASIIGRRL